ncbi:MAG TPA: hypothetical protein VGU25_12810 [Acidobacteriaceae bacterium]|nr:hypothetical protein [Acidobacteriaceae bacterium]
MKLKLTIASLAAATILLPAAHAQMSGTSHPEKLDDAITTSPDPSTTPHYVKPSPAVPMTAPVTATDTPEPAAASPAVACMSAVPQETTQGRRPLAAANDPDANIVLSAPDVPGQVNEGTPLYVELQTPLSTTESRVGDTFLAALTQPVRQHGQVLLPIGSQIRGRISEIHGGRRISGRASIRLRPESVTLPDGSTHPLYAEVTGLGQFSSSHVNSEGTIIGDSHPKAALTAVAAATGGAAVAGAALGGGVGAAVGAGVGASLGTIWWLKRDVQQELPSGTRLILSLDQPLNVSPTAQTAELSH